MREKYFYLFSFKKFIYLIVLKPAPTARHTVQLKRFKYNFMYTKYEDFPRR